MKQFITLLLSVFVYTSCVSAQEQEITFVYENYPPYEFPTDSGPDGITASRIKEVCKRLGYRPRFVFAPWARALKLVKTGKVDGIFSIRKNKDREAFLSYTSSLVAKAEDRIFSLKGRLPPIQNLEDLKKFSIGVVKGYSYGNQFDHHKSLKKEFSSENTSLIFRLNKGWLDTVVMNREVFKHYSKIANLSAERFTMQPYVITSQELFVAFSRKAPNWKKFTHEFSEELKKLNKK